MRFVEVESFDQWRDEARGLISLGIRPADVHWGTASDQAPLFSLDEGTTQDYERLRHMTKFSVPPAFLELARWVACHRDTARWQLLYRALWRLVHGERQLLQLSTDDDVHALNQMQKSVSRDVHKMKAFVRFRKVLDASGGDNYIAWHRPDHRIVRLAAPFFARRFPIMDWAILTPQESVSWDRHELTFGPGVPASEAPSEDALEDLWRTYYASIFNPARINVATMKREMPMRHWATLPEARIIDDLLREAPKRVDEMIERSEGIAETAMRFMPAELDLVALEHAARHCRACPLHGPATQTVFGRGAVDARWMIIGEQPGDQEDIAGEPFIGPAGKLLDAALAQAGVTRADVYVTNVVKHFKFVETAAFGTSTLSKQRLHKKPNSREIFACRPWLEAEIAAVRPEAILCLGSTAAQAIFGRDFRLTQQRGKFLVSEWCQHTVATWHPAAILRMPDAARREQMQSQLVNDLRMLAAKWSE